MLYRGSTRVHECYCIRALISAVSGGARLFGHRVVFTPSSIAALSASARLSGVDALCLVRYCFPGHSESILKYTPVKSPCQSLRVSSALHSAIGIQLAAIYIPCGLRYNDFRLFQRDDRVFTSVSSSNKRRNANRDTR